MVQRGSIAACVMVSIDHGAALSDNLVKATAATQMAIDAAIYGEVLATACPRWGDSPLVSKLITHYAEQCGKRARESLNL